MRTNIARFEQPGRNELHVAGDGAIDAVLDAFQKVLGSGSGYKLRRRIEQCSILHDDQIARMKKLGISLSFLMCHVHFWRQAFQDLLLGPARAGRLDSCRSAINGGLRISLHSDYNVTLIDPLRCVQNAVLRDMREGGSVLNHLCESRRRRASKLLGSTPFGSGILTIFAAA